MASFENAVALILQHEGGYVNNPADRGGATNFGITQKTYDTWSEQLGAPRGDVKLMPIGMAKRIYKELFWDFVKGDDIVSQPVANFLVDVAVLRGSVNAIKAAQAALAIKQDGLMGPVTLQCLNAATPCVFINSFRKLCVQAACALVARDVTQAPFLNGWVNRFEEMTQVVNVLAQGRV